ncbi:filamentous hemagglutinin [Dickeya zeae]|nr:filamentous hemagglutinin [Dickeya zeae]
MEAEYQKAGASGSFNAGVEGGKLVTDIAGLLAGGTGVVKVTAGVTEKIVAKVAGKAELITIAGSKYPVTIAPTTKVVTQYGALAEEGPLPQSIVATFRSGTYAETVTTQPTVLYRVYGGTAEKFGGYWTTTQPAGPVQSIIDSALNPAWGNPATKVVKIEVPPGITLYQGQAASQGGLVGGGAQVLFTKDMAIDPSWVRK